VAGRLSLDTTFLIDLQRERSRGEEGPAHDLLRGNRDAELCLSSLSLGEFAEGFHDGDDPVLRVVREGHILLPVDEASAMAYAAVTRELRREGRLIGSNDLWIAAVSLRHELPLVTADVAAFRRVPGLEIVAYR